MGLMLEHGRTANVSIFVTLRSKKNARVKEKSEGITHTQKFLFLF